MKTTSPWRKIAVCLNILTLAAFTQTHAEDGSWLSDSAGNWSDASKWFDGIVADGTDAEADFIVDLSANRTITNDAGTGDWSGTIGSMRFADISADHNWTIAGGTLTLATTAEAPVISMANGTTTISSILAGTQGFRKLGQGTLTLTSTNTYTGPTSIEAGRVQLYTATGKITSDTTVRYGAVLEFGGNGNSDHFGDDSKVTLNGGTLQFGVTGTTTGVNRETIGAVEFDSGATISLQRRANGSDNIGLTVSSLDRVGRGVLTIETIASGLGQMGTGAGEPRFQVSVKNPPPVVNGMVSASVISLVGDLPTFLTYSGSDESGWMESVSYTSIVNSATFIENSGTNAIASVAGAANPLVNVDTSYVAIRTIRNITGTGKITLSSGGLIFMTSSAITIANPVDFGTEALVYAANPLSTLSGALTSTNGFTKSGVGTTVLSNASNDFGGGPVTINEGILRIDGGQDRLPTDSALSVRHKGTFDLNGQHQTVASLSGEGLVTNGAAATAVNFSITGFASTEFSGTIEDGAGTVALLKNGPGVLSLTGANTYTGGTLVAAGTLLINGNSGAATATVEVDEIATLGGNGLIGGDVVVDGTLSPGNSAGVLAMEGALTLNSGATVFMEIGSDSERGSTYDGIDVGGLLTYDGDLVLSISGLMANGSWLLFDFSEGNWAGNFETVSLDGAYAGSLSRADALWSGTVGGQAWEFDQSTGMLTVVPEPSVLLLMGCAGMLLLFHARRRRARGLN